METTQTNETLRTSRNPGVRLQAPPTAWTDQRLADCRAARVDALPVVTDRATVPVARPFYPFKWG
jgi:hypothetical protein